MMQLVEGRKHVAKICFSSFPLQKFLNTFIQYIIQGASCVKLNLRKKTRTGKQALALGVQVLTDRKWDQNTGAFNIFKALFLVGSVFKDASKANDKN